MDHDGDVEKGDFDEDEDSGEDEETYPDLMDEVFSTGIEAYIKKVKTTTSLLRMLVLIDFVYLSQFSAKDIKEINKTKEMILTDDRIYFNLERFSALEEFSDEIKVIVDKYSDDKKKYIKKMGELVDRHPDVPELNAVYFEALLVTKKNFRAYQFAYKRYNRAKDHYITRLMYAEYLVLMGKYKDALKLFDNKPGLDALTTENVPFTVKSVCDFCACYVLILLSINKIAEAEPYYLIIVESKNWGYFSLLAMEAMTKRKQKVVRKVLKEML